MIHYNGVGHTETNFPSNLNYTGKIVHILGLIIIASLPEPMVTYYELHPDNTLKQNLIKNLIIFIQEIFAIWVDTKSFKRTMCELWAYF